MAEFNWTAYATIQTYLSTELNSLADGGNKLGAAFNNSSALDLWMDFELYLGSLTPGTGGFVLIYRLPSLDDTNYSDGGDSVDPPAGAYNVRSGLTTSTGAKRVIFPPMPLTPGYQKFLLRNEAGAAWASSGNTLKYRVYSKQSV